MGMTNGELIIHLYEMARKIGLDHKSSDKLTEIAFDNMYEEDNEVLYVATYIALRATQSGDSSDKNAKRYVAAVKVLANDR